jgi:hypothetical protein
VDKEFATMLKQMLAGTNVRNDPASLKKAQELHQWLDELIYGERLTVSAQFMERPYAP